MKTIAIYAVQAAMGLVGLAAGCAKLAGADVMVDAFSMLGLGSSFLIIAGAVEILGGLCLLMPRAGLFGAVLLASVVVGTAGLTIGQVANKVLHNGSGIATVGAHQAMHSGAYHFSRPAAVSTKDGIDI